MPIEERVDASPRLVQRVLVATSLWQHSSWIFVVPAQQTLDSLESLAWCRLGSVSSLKVSLSTLLQFIILQSHPHLAFAFLTLRLI